MIDGAVAATIKTVVVATGRSAEAVEVAEVVAACVDATIRSVIKQYDSSITSSLCLLLSEKLSYPLYLSRVNRHVLLLALNKLERCGHLPSNFVVYQQEQTTNRPLIDESVTLV